MRSPAAASNGDRFFEIDNAGNFQIDFGPSTGPELLISDSTTTNGTVTVKGNLVVEGTCTGRDRVFQSDYELESIEDHASLVWGKSYLPGAGPTPEGGTSIDVFAKTTGILQELVKAQIYIVQLHERNARLQAKHEELERELQELKKLVTNRTSER